MVGACAAVAVKQGVDSMKCDACTAEDAGQGYRKPFQQWVDEHVGRGIKYGSPFRGSPFSTNEWCRRKAQQGGNLHDEGKFE